MLKTYLYLPTELEIKITTTAKTHKLSKAEVMRQALERGLAGMQNNTNASLQAFLKLAEIGKKSKFRGPHDSSERIDELLWDKDWSKDE